MKIKLTKGELKKQRDALRQFQRYLPTLQLKKQQLQMEILHWNSVLEDVTGRLNARTLAASAWAGFLSEDSGLDISQAVKPAGVRTGIKNIAGVDLPYFEAVDFYVPSYDLFTAPPWVDAVLEALQEIVSFRQELKVIEQAVAVLKTELRVTTQRVNLFEKVKIPQAQESIRRIKIYIGDQMSNAVGRCKIAKRKIEEFETAGV